MTELQKKAREFRLPMATTPENIETAFFTGDSVFLTFGNKTIMCGYSYQGRGRNGYFAAIYEFATDDHTCEGEIRLTAVSDEFFPDNGSAAAWALS